jgi:ATPase subunit of ABC transporter with duplicated ATPase domains
MSDIDEHTHRSDSKRAGAPPATLEAWAADEAATAVRRVMHAVRARENVFITGAAGTGKSTLLRLLAMELPDTPVLAPTGVAALRAGGIPTPRRLLRRHPMFAFTSDRQESRCPS